MPNLETIIRPFQTRDLAPPRRLAASESANIENLRLEIGRNAAAGGQVLVTSYSSSVSKYMTKQEKEVCSDRETHTKTVVAEGDVHVEVDIEVVDKITTKRGTGPDFQKTKTKFCVENQDPDDPAFNPNA